MTGSPFDCSEILCAEPKRRSLFGSRVREARKRAGLSQAELANAVDLERTAITQIESGRALPSLPRLIALCNALKVTPNDLLWGKPANNGEG